jgi:ATP-dependent Clp protease adaptor protein ClpS
MRFYSCTAVDEYELSGFDRFHQAHGNPRCMSEPGHGGNGGSAEQQGGLMVAEPEAKTKRPPMYKVILLNDDYTPMDFVVMVLEQIFRRPHQDALNVMLEVHQKGAGLAGVYTRDVAETKVDQVTEYARINDYPLQCTLEQDS